MSFSSNIKEEITKTDSTRTEDISELSAIIRNSTSTINQGITITTENNAVAKRIYNLFLNIYDINLDITIRKRSGFSNNLVYILNYNHNILKILKDLSIIDTNTSPLNIPAPYIISDEEGIKAYLKGLFEICGSISDPKASGYHLEFIVSNYSYAQKISELLNTFNLNSKVIKREKNYMIYIKEAEKISDFLKLIKSYNGVMYFEDIRIYRDYKNMNNRLNNCELANMDKVFISAQKQLEDIQKIETNIGLDNLDNKLKEAITYRKKYPESSLSELSTIMSKELAYPISKSGLNHRFRKIKEIADKYN